MKITGRLSLCLFLTLSLAVAVLLSSCAPTGTEEPQGPVTITILQTSDLHGMINPYDYTSDMETASSLAHAAAAISRERAEDPELLLIDAGDLCQGNYIEAFRSQSPHPAIAALNYLDYDAWVQGNHEFNFEFPAVENGIAAFNGKTLLGNAYTVQGARWQEAWHIFDVKGVKVAVFGLTAPHVSRWEGADPSHYNNMIFTEPMDETGKILDELEGKADVIVGAIHYGLEGEYGSAGACAIAETYGDRLDALLIGHAHEAVDQVIGGVPVLEPGSGGECLSKLTIVLENTEGVWTVNREATQGELIDTSTMEPDPAFLAEFRGLHESSLVLAAEKIGEVGETFLENTEFLPGIPLALIQDTPLLDLISTVMMEAGGADVAQASLFNVSSNLEKGDFLHRDSTKIYHYENTMQVVEISGAQLKAIMEYQSGRFFNQYRPGDVTVSFNEDMRIYHYDVFSGVDYEIDISRPEGQRLVNVMFRGQPLRDDTLLTLALNSHRYGSLRDAGFLSEDQLIMEGGDIRNLISEYVAALDGPLLPVCDNNWRIVGADLKDPQKDMIYDMVRSGALEIPASEDGRIPNVEALNGPRLREQGVLPPL